MTDYICHDWVEGDNEAFLLSLDLCRCGNRFRSIYYENKGDLDKARREKLRAAGWNFHDASYSVNLYPPGKPYPKYSREERLARGYALFNNSCNAKGYNYREANAPVCKCGGKLILWSYMRKRIHPDFSYEEYRYRCFKCAAKYDEMIEDVEET